MIEQLHFIRPGFFYLVLPLIAYILWLLFLRGNHQKVYTFIDKALSPHILIAAEKSQTKPWLVPLCIFIGGLITITALTGPSFEKIPQPVFKQQNTVIVLLDLSASMNSQDIKPTRLTRAKQKLNDILALRQSQQTALIAYAADAYVVTPITDDYKTISTHIPNLSTDAISKQGSRIDRAIDKALTLLTQTGINKGHIIALTDGVTLDSKLKTSLDNLQKARHSLSIIGFATKDGSPIPKPQGGFITDNNNNIILSKLDSSTLKKTAALGKGTFIPMTIDNTDINRVLADQKAADNKEQSDRISDEWKDMGAYLSLLLIPLLLFCFRRGALMLIPLCLLIHNEPSHAIDWQNWFLNQDQQAYQNYQNQDYAAAAEQFNQSEWKASSQYKNGDYQESLENWSDNSSDGLYNKGNALARMGKYAEAIQHYEQSLALHSDNADAQHNLELLKKALQQNQQQQDSSEQGQGQEQNSEQSQQDSSQQQNSNNTDQEESNNNSSTSEEQSTAESTEQEAASNTDNTDQAEKDYQQALQEAEESNEQGDEPEKATPLSEQEALAQEKAILQQQWLDRIEDNPGGLLKRKFKYQDYINKQQQESQPW